MNPEESQIWDITEEVWSSILGLPLKSMDSPIMDDEGIASITGCIQITGAWSGAVTIECSGRLARKATCLMFEMEQDEPGSEEIRDAIGELINMIAGGIKQIVPSPSQISLPVVVEGREYRLIVPGSHPVTQVAFNCEEMPLQIRVVQGDSNTEQATAGAIAGRCKK